MRVWIALALLASSWLWGLSYYEPGNWLTWGAVLIVGTLLLADGQWVRPGAARSRLALAMLLPAVWFLPWPHRAGPLAMFVGLALPLLPWPRRWPAAVGGGAVKAGAILLVQSLAMLSYAQFTARSHDLPGPLVKLVAGIARVLGAEAAVDGPYVVIPSVREVHRLAATWDLLFDPASFTFLLGGMVLIGLSAWQRMPAGRRWTAWIQAGRVFALATAAWLIVRAGLLVALLLHRSMRAELALPLTTMNQFLNPWVHLLALAGPVLLAWWLVRVPWGGPPEDIAEEAAGLEPPFERLDRMALALVLVGAGILAFLTGWDPVGSPKRGRVMVVERHSNWEPTTRAYTTESYGEDDSYTYGAI